MIKLGVTVQCAVRNCIHNYKGKCDVDGWINITITGQCLDMASLTDKERQDMGL